MLGEAFYQLITCICGGNKWDLTDWSDNGDVVAVHCISCFRWTMYLVS
jgi:hypothetical protein